MSANFFAGTEILFDLETDRLLGPNDRCKSSRSGRPWPGSVEISTFCPLGITT